MKCSHGASYFLYLIRYKLFINKTIYCKSKEGKKCDRPNANAGYVI